MAWLWRKKSKTPAAEAPAPAAAPAPGASEMMNPVVNAAVASSHRTDEDWRKLEAQQRKEQKRLQKEMEKEAKKAAKEMKEQVKKARKERAKVEKVAKKHARTVLKIQKKERKSERKRVKTMMKATRAEEKRVKTMMKATRAEEKRRKRLTRKRKREEKRRRKQMRQQDDLHHQLVQAEIETEEMRAQRDANAAVVTAMTAVAAAPQSTASGVTVVTLDAPKFKEDKSCKTCASNFQRLPTRRRHHCRNCGDSFCSKCLSKTKRPIPWFKLDKPQKVCFSCDVQVFNGVGSNGVLTSVPEAVPVPTASSPIQASPAQPETEASPLRVQRAASFQSESPENDSPASSPSSRGLSFRLRPRSRRDSGGSSKGKKNKLWSLPLRPLLKRKASADQLRNRSWDLDLRIEKEEMLARQRRSQMIDLSSAPQFAQAS